MILDRLVHTLLPKQEQFFEQLAELAAKVDVAAATFLELVDAPPGQFVPIWERLRTIEHDADTLAHNLYDELDRRFVTPIDREDIAALTSSLDDVVDGMEHSAALMVHYHLPELTPPMKDLIRITRSCVSEVVPALSNLKHMHDAAALGPRFVAVNTLENDADTVFRKGIETLFGNPPGAVDLLRQRDLLHSLEDGVDFCEDVMDVLRSVVVKNG